MILSTLRISEKSLCKKSLSSDSRVSETSSTIASVYNFSRRGILHAWTSPGVVRHIRFDSNKAPGFSTKDFTPEAEQPSKPFLIVRYLNSANNRADNNSALYAHCSEDQQNCQRLHHYHSAYRLYSTCTALLDLIRQKFSASSRCLT